MQKINVFSKIYVIIFYVTGNFLLAQGTDSLLIADKTQSFYDIVYVGNSSGVDETSVKELSKYLQQISGAKFVIKNKKKKKPAIYIGDKDQNIFNGKFSHLQTRNSFSINVQSGSNDETDIYLIGEDSTATAFAVYTFLEDLGCRWIMAGKIGEVVPTKAKLQWQINTRTEIPDFPFRQIWWAYGGPTETAELIKMWKLRNKVVYPLINHGHNLTSTLPPKEYLDEHPEYYALVNGERRASQVCTSNPEVIQLIIERINKYFDENPQVEAYSLCPDDNTDFCECDNCKALDVGGKDKYLKDKPVVTDRYIHFLNLVAQGIQKSHPGKKVTTYAYVNYSTPPIKEKIDPNVVIVFTSSMYCGAHGIGDLQCSSRQDMKRDIAGWAEATSNIYIYDYDPTPFNAELPWPLFGARYREMSEYLAMGIKGFTFESHNSWATMAPNFYVAAKVMWDANLDFDALMDDYTKSYFAESAAPIREYYRVLESALATTPNKIEWGQVAYPQIFTEEVLLQCRTAIDQATSSAESEVVKERVQAVALGYEYLENYLKLRKATTQKISLVEFNKKSIAAKISLTNSMK